LAEPVLLEVRERRSRFGRVVKWVFLAFQLVMVLLMLGTCAAVTPFLGGPDPEVAIGAGLFGAAAIGLLWTVWPLGTLVLGVLTLLTRGATRLIPAPAEAGITPSASTAPPPGRGGSVPEAGRRP
jgi:hypothetical protein